MLKLPYVTYEENGKWYVGVERDTGPGHEQHAGPYGTEDEADEHRYELDYAQEHPDQ
jgi:predicted GIY-YIG superfamily endonuclease